jgi:hypothetical protein
MTDLGIQMLHRTWRVIFGCNGAAAAADPEPESGIGKA